MNINNKAALENSGIVEIDPQVLEGYPLVALTEENLRIVSSYRFSSLTYERPRGDDTKGIAKITVINSTGEFEVQTLVFHYRFSENERLIEASKPDAFSVRREALLRMDPKSIKPIDVVPTYSDVIVQNVRYFSLPSFEHPELDVKLDDLNVKSNKDEKQKRKKYKDNPYPGYAYLHIEFYFIDDGLKKIQNTEIAIKLEYSQEETKEMYATRMDEYKLSGLSDKDIAKGLVKSIYEVTRFQIRNEFLQSGPPTSVPTEVLTPGVGVSFRKIDYIPPTSITDTLAYFQVEYEYEGRIINERVKFHFAKSIQDVALDTIKSIPLSDFLYTNKSRLTPPTYMKLEDFKYDGEIEGVRIEQINYNYNDIKMDDRYVKVELVVGYRLVNLAIYKKLEFRYTKAEYISGNFRQAKTENGSIDIHEMFYEPKNLYKAYHKEGGLHKKLKETAKIVPGYPYEEIKSIEIINFDENSQYGMFKIVAIENYGERRYERTFEKRIELIESYNEAKLEDLTEKDVKVNQQFLPLFASEAISERAFEIDDPIFRIFALKYNVPKDHEKQAIVHLQIGTDLKTKTIKKRIEFTYSKQEFQNILWEQDIKKYLRSIDPSTITLKIDLNGKPVEFVTKDMVEGVPVGIEYSIEYKPPRVGTTHTRLKLRMWKGNVKIAFEQTLIFAEPMER